MCFNQIRERLRNDDEVIDVDTQKELNSFKVKVVEDSMAEKEFLDDASI